MTDNETVTSKRRSTLEEEIDVIEELDRLRSGADELRRTGFDQLRRVVTTEASDEELSWWVDEEPADLIHPSLVYLAAMREFAQDDQQKQDKFRGIPLSDIVKTTDIVAFFDLNPVSARLPNFQAARVLQALLVSGDTIFSEKSMLAYYAVVRELATVGENKGFGSARATDGGIASAFMTGECARAINAMVDALQNTADVIDSVLSSFREWTHVVSLERHHEKNDEFRKWMIAETRRIALFAYTTIASVGRRSAITPTSEDFKILLARGADYDSEQKTIGRFFKAFCDRFNDSADQAVLQINSALRTISKHYTDERKVKHCKSKAADSSKMSRDRLSAKGRAMGHGVANRAVKHALELAMEAKAVEAELGKYLTNGMPPDSKLPDAVTMFVSQVRRRSTEVRKLLASTSMYLESVMDREIERASVGHFNAGELACAAASYAQLEKPELDRRLERATEILCRSMAMDGTFAVFSSLDTDTHGYRAVILGSEVLKAIAQLFEKVQVDIEPDIVKRILSYFTSKAVRSAAGKVVGWPGDEPRHPIRSSRWTSALAILALDQITRMLDKLINRRVFRHFSVRSAKELGDKPRLEDLFYPDYGLASVEAGSLENENSGESVAYFLERMRAHVRAIGKPPGYEDPCYSLLLYGPPGTGKTMLIESLAVSSNADYVEITPSDFLVEGESLIERRARNVFRCLSFLTRTVILFDEFDPMIRSRKLTSQKDNRLDFYAFLTPGMLPKLKLLNDHAKKRNVAYCLITNRVGTLDEAAIRTGRFDYKVGVYPPDLLSRAGRLAFVVNKVRRREKEEGNDVKLTEDGRKRMVEIIRKTAGGGMTSLGKQGNFSVPKRLADAKGRSFLAYIFGTSIETKYGPKDAEDEQIDADSENPIEANAPYRKYEKLHWNWVHGQDKLATGASSGDSLLKAVETPPK